MNVYIKYNLPKQSLFLVKLMKQNKTKHSAPWAKSFWRYDKPEKS